VTNDSPRSRAPGEHVLDLVDRHAHAGVVRVQLHDLAAIAGSIEPRVDAIEAELRLGIEVDAAMHGPAIAVVKCPVEVAQILLAAGGQRAHQRGHRERTW